jgi:hypothetical protein
MTLGAQFMTLLVLAIPVAAVSWTVTHEEIFREPREWLVRRSETAPRLWQRKMFYAFTCEYCLSHYVSIVTIAFTQFTMLFNDWRGYVVAVFSLVWVSNFYMSLFGRLRLEIRHERQIIRREEERAHSRDDEGA